jgi:hypothetical protein
MFVKSKKLAHYIILIAQPSSQKNISQFAGEFGISVSILTASGSDPQKGWVPIYEEIEILHRVNDDVKYVSSPSRLVFQFTDISLSPSQSQRSAPESFCEG